MCTSTIGNIKPADPSSLNKPAISLNAIYRWAVHHPEKTNQITPTKFQSSLLDEPNNIAAP
jgi:hypothetical protein